MEPKPKYNFKNGVGTGIKVSSCEMLFFVTFLYEYIFHYFTLQSSVSKQIFLSKTMHLRIFTRNMYINVIQTHIDCIITNAKSEDLSVVLMCFQVFLNTKLKSTGRCLPV